MVEWCRSGGHFHPVMVLKAKHNIEDKNASIGYTLPNAPDMRA